jgi:hypothetical protein
LISLRHRFLFVHIPKTAGNSIQSVLRSYYDDELEERVARRFAWEIRHMGYTFERRERPGSRAW